AVSCCAFPRAHPSHTLSLHDALPIFGIQAHRLQLAPLAERMDREGVEGAVVAARDDPHPRQSTGAHLQGGEAGEGFDAFEMLVRSEEHTSELQSRFDLVCRLLLEKKK